MKAPLSLLVFWCLTAFAVSASTAEACSCLGNRSACHALSTHRVVFAGQVIAIRNIDTAPSPERSQSVTFRVDQAIAGVEGKTMELLAEHIGAGGCGYRFEAGGQYLVYGWQRPDGQVSASICSRTRPFADAAEDLAYFRSFGSSLPSEGRISVLALLKPDSWTLPGLPFFRGLRVSIEGLGTRKAGVTGEDGSFDVLVPPGRYRLDIEEPSGFRVGPQSGFYSGPMIELPDPRACVHIELVVYPRGFKTVSQTR